MGVHAAPQPTGASGAADTAKRARPERVPKPAARARSIVRAALDSAAAKSLAEKRAATAAARRARAERRGGAASTALADGMVTPQSSVSRNTSTEMSSGGSGPLQKRQAIEAAVFDSVDMEADDDASGEADGGEQAAAILEQALGSGLGVPLEQADSSDEEGARAPPPEPPPPEPPRPPPLPMPQMGLAKTLGQMAAAAAASTPTTDETTRTKPRTTRVTGGLERRGHRQSVVSAKERLTLREQGQQARRQRERQVRDMEHMLSTLLANTRISIGGALSMAGCSRTPAVAARRRRRRRSGLRLLSRTWGRLRSTSEARSTPVLWPPARARGV